MSSSKTIELEVSLAIRKAIESKSLNAASAMTIIHKGMELLNAFPGVSGAEKKRILVSVLEQVSAGSDGILGTADDLLPEATLKSIKVMLEGDLVGDIVDTFVAITKGAPVDTQKLVSIGMRLKTVAMGLVQCFKSKAKPIPKDKVPLPAPVPVTTAMKTIHNELWVPITVAEKDTKAVS
jgi:hypothetical protein